MLLTIMLGTALAVEPVATTYASLAGWESGLQWAGQGGAKHTLYSQEDSVLYSDVYVRSDVLLQVTPDYLRGGAQIEFSPMAMLIFRLKYESSWYFGNIKSVYGFQDASDRYGDAERDENINDYGNDVRVTGTAIVQAKVGPAIVALVFDRAWIRQSPGPAVVGDYWYEPEYQMLVALDDKIFQQTTVLLYEKELATEKIDSVLIGVMSTYRRAQTSRDVIYRAGPMAVIKTHGGDRSVLLLAQPQFVSRTYGPPVPFLAVRGTMKF
jgi:hypothetical protein